MTDQYYLRVCALRSLMTANGWDAIVLRGNDPHSNEYLIPRYQAVTYISGFTGEAGDLVVTADEAGLWTDSRYFIQAVEQLDGSGISLHKTRLPESVDIPQYLAMKGLRKVAVDSLCENVDSAAEIKEACRNVEGFELIGIPDLVSMVWEDRPGIPAKKIISLDEDSVGLSRTEKIYWLRGYLSAEGFDNILVSALDEIAWLLNVRGCDIDYNPLVFSYLLVSRDRVRWFVKKDDRTPCDEDTVDTFEAVDNDGVEVEQYEDVEAAVMEICSKGESICYDPSSLNASLFETITGGTAIKSPIQLKKAVKTAQEIEGIREAYLEDGLAVEKFLFWLERTLEQRPVSEWEAACRLGAFRKEIPGYTGDSFETISAWGKGAALPHYMTPKDGSTLIERHGLYLCDSGGQYMFGTTDITRTVPTGPLTDLEMEDYTLVLKGMIDLSMAVFPYGTAGCQIDALAREPLWSTGRNFGHGTGHGIGYFLCVHEGPQSIRQNFLSQPLLPGMITSNEPGLYREGKHGIRHENIILCREAYSNEFGNWLCFETLTCCHIDTSAIIVDLLTEKERDWLNSYNEKVFRTFSSAIEDEDFKSWLRNKTLAI